MALFWCWMPLPQIFANQIWTSPHTNKCVRRQAGAELCQAQVKLDDIVVIVVEVVVKAMVEVEVQLLFRVGGGWVVG